MTTTRTCNGKLGFAIHALVFVLTIALLLTIDLLAGVPLWIQWVLLGWVPGLIAHAVFGPARHAKIAAAN